MIQNESTDTGVFAGNQAVQDLQVVTSNGQTRLWNKLYDGSSIETVGRARFTDHDHTFKVAQVADQYYALSLITAHDPNELQGLVSAQTAICFDSGNDNESGIENEDDNENDEEGKVVRT